MTLTRVTSGSADLEWRGALLCTLTYSLCVIHTEVEAQCISDVSDVPDVPDVPDVLSDVLSDASDVLPDASDVSDDSTPWIVQFSSDDDRTHRTMTGRIGRITGHITGRLSDVLPDDVGRRPDDDRTYRTTGRPGLR